MAQSISDRIEIGITVTEEELERVGQRIQIDYDDMDTQTLREALVVAIEGLAESILNNPTVYLCGDREIPRLKALFESALPY